MTNYSFVFSGQTSGGTLSAGDLELVYGGGSGLNTIVSSGGNEDILNGGVADFTTISSGGYEVISLGGATSHTHVLSGGTQVILPGGSAVDPNYDAGSIVVTGGVVVFSAGLVVSATTGTTSGLVLSGASDVVYNGGVTTGTFLSVSGGRTPGETISSGGVASGSIIGNEGTSGSLVGRASPSGRSSTTAARWSSAPEAPPATPWSAASRTTRAA